MDKLGFNVNTFAYVIILLSHIWMLFYPLTAAQMVPHALANLGAVVYLIYYN